MIALGLPIVVRQCEKQPAAATSLAVFLDAAASSTQCFRVTCTKGDIRPFRRHPRGMADYMAARVMKDYRP